MPLHDYETLSRTCNAIDEIGIDLMEELDRTDPLVLRWLRDWFDNHGEEATRRIQELKNTTAASNIRLHGGNLTQFFDRPPVFEAYEEASASLHTPPWIRRRMASRR